MIQIEEPKVESLIMERLHAGSFDTVEQTLLDALTHAPPPARKGSSGSGPTGEAILKAMQRCPVEDFQFGTERFLSPISDPVTL